MGAPHILLVDDEVLAIMALEQLLIDEGFRVTTAFDGKEALDLWGQDRFDALVTDIRMPVMTGDELARRVRGEKPGLPVVIASGYATGDVTQRLRATIPEPLAVLAKPIRVEDVVGALKRMLPAGQ
ncbi:response regulator [Azospirillum doebereinerae]|uniref:Response regulator n=1 Tax=Azospirillum doebereinerae TaxID=92933 RepID=A0A433J7N2_9PROT|nr:response regulator [Azospirillum doebereinerae]MCG5243238.1 response regulator [Azospirillum doebereinerae]RUQ69702.1 response regulator [Azospirillum doebereinerae]